MLTATIAALALWVPAPWAVTTRVAEHGAAATFNPRTGAYVIGGQPVARMVAWRCRAGYAIRNLTHDRLTVRFIPS
jgi:hypothetical protein